MTACVLCVLYIKELFIHMRLYDYWWYFRVSEAWKEVRLSEEILGISKSGLLHPLCSYIGPELPTGWCGSWLKLVSVQAIWTSVEDEFGHVVLSEAGSSRIAKSSEWMHLMINCLKPELDFIFVWWTQGLWTLPRELLFILLTRIDSWWSARLRL